MSERERDLLPCPFCGSEPRELAHADESTTIECPSPDCIMVSTLRDYPRAEAVAAWNRRNPPVPDGACQCGPMAGFRRGSCSACGGYYVANRTPTVPDGAEPVAWRFNTFEHAPDLPPDIVYFGSEDTRRAEHLREHGYTLTPLYTHPVPDGGESSLTDAERAAIERVVQGLDGGGFFRDRDVLRRLLDRTEPDGGETIEGWVPNWESADPRTPGVDPIQVFDGETPPKGHYGLDGYSRATLTIHDKPDGGESPTVVEADLSKCPSCGGPADNGHDRGLPPTPYDCTRCATEPVPEGEDVEALVERLADDMARSIETAREGSLQTVPNPAVIQGWIARLRALSHRTTAGEGEANLRTLVAELSRDIEHLQARHGGWPRDHACRRCATNSDMLVDGFLCARHRAADIAALTRTQEPEANDG